MVATTNDRVGLELEGLQEGAIYRLSIHREGKQRSGTIEPLLPEGVPWQYQVKGHRTTLPFLWPTMNECQFTRGEDPMALRFQRASFFRPSYLITDENEPLGTLYQTSLLRTRYELRLNDGTEWTFRLPLFTRHFWGESNSAARCLIAPGPSTFEWQVAFETAPTNDSIVLALAVVHYHWQHYG